MLYAIWDFPSYCQVWHGFLSENFESTRIPKAKKAIKMDIGRLL